MATQLDELVVKLSADISDLNSGLSEGSKVLVDSTARMEKSVADFAEHSSGHMFSFSHAAETALGVFEGEVLLEGLHKLGEMAKELFEELVTEAVKAAEQQENAVNRMNVALASAGQYTRDASHEMQEYAHSLQNTTVYSEENVLQASALIETLGRLDQEGLQKATSAAVNLSSALGIDLNTAAMMVGKAAAGNVTVFQRYGMAIEQGVTPAETFANALKAIGGMGDVAAQRAMTYEGAVAQLNHAHEDGHKILGEVIVKNQAVIDVIKEVTNLFNENNESTKKNIQSYKELVAEGLIMAIDALVAFAAAIDGVYRLGSVAFEAVRGAAYTMSLGIVTAIDGPIAAISGLLSLIPGIGHAFEKVRDEAIQRMTDISAEIGKSAQSIDESLSGPTKAYQKVEDAALKVRDAAEKGYAAIKSGAESTIEPTNMASRAIAAMSEETTKLGEEGAKLAKKMEADDPAKKYQHDLEALKAANQQKLISDQQYLSASKKAKETFDEARSQANQKEIEDLIKNNELLIAVNDSGNQAEIAGNKAKILKLEAAEDAHGSFMLGIERKRQQEEDQINKARLQAGMSAMSELASFQSSKNSEMAAVGKAAAVAQTLVSTYQGATSAAASLAGIPIVGPELAIAAAAAFIAGGLGRVAQIEGVGLQSGIDSVPGIGNSDNFPAVLAPGEGVMDAGTNKDMKKFFAGGDNPMISILKSIDSKIAQLGAANNQPIMVQVDGRTLITAMRDQLRMGRTVFA